MRKIMCVIGMLLCLVPMVGFGMCGVFGVISGLRNITTEYFIYSALLIGCGALGIAISVGLGFAIRELSKSFRSPPPGHSPAGE
jgi:hypothetical protein